MPVSRSLKQVNTFSIEVRLRTRATLSGTQQRLMLPFFFIDLGKSEIYTPSPELSIKVTDDMSINILG